MHNLHHRIKPKVLPRPKIDKIIYIAVVIGPLLTLPQIYSIWVQGEGGVSIISWVAYLIAAIIWLLYGVAHKDKPIIVVEAIWVLLDVLIIIGLLRI